MTTLPPSSGHRHRSHPPPSTTSSSSGQVAPPSRLAIATAVVRRLVREKSSYVVELAGQEARLADLLSKRKRGGRENEGGDGEEDEDENWGYWVKQEERALEETRAVFGPLTDRVLTATEKLEDILKFETWNDEEVHAAKDMVAMARRHTTNDPTSTPDSGS